MPTASRTQAAAGARVHRAEQEIFDGSREAPVEFAPTGPPNRSTSRRVDPGLRRAPIAVGPGRPAIVVPAVPMGGGLPGAMPEFPVQLNKVQPPPLREQTLARDRLLDWLGAKIHDRVVLVLAEAGYGKTTLLADFSRRTRLRTFWYRLDRGDRDWVGFIAHLAAAVRVHVPDFGPATAALLRETATTAPSRDTVFDTFIRELGELPSDASVLILDDFHLVDDNADIRHITRELLARAPERLTFVFASRRVPPVPLARLRALGEVAELGTDDLRFDEAETDRLFRETYDMPLERGLISELSKRTEGWAASLQLVRAALHDRDAVQARAFIGSLSGAEGHLYDYLAEEVIGDLPPALQDFLMRTSILETIDLDLGPVAGGVTSEEARSLMAEAERLGLVTRRGVQGRNHVRAHRLVRDFLRARLFRTLDADEVAALHRAVAERASMTDWRAAAQHFVAAGDALSARRIVNDSIDSILATGAYASADALIGRLDAEVPETAGFVLAARIAMTTADRVRGRDLAERAHIEDPRSGAAALTLMTARTFAGDVQGAVSASELLEQSADPRFAQIAKAFRRTLETSVAGSIPAAISEVERLLSMLDDSDRHYRGIAELNLASMLVPAGEPTEALAAAERAVGLLAQTSGVIELTSARLMRATALAIVGRLEEAREEASQILRATQRGQALEVACELGWIEVAFGDEHVAFGLLAALPTDLESDTGSAELLPWLRAELRLRQNDGSGAAFALAGLDHGVPRSTVAFEARRTLAQSRAMLALGKAPEARALADEAFRLASHQGAGQWARASRLVAACVASPGELSRAVVDAGKVDPSCLSIVAEALLDRVGDLEPAARNAVIAEAERRPERWRLSVRRALESPGRRDGVVLAELLSKIGIYEDVDVLKAVDRGQRGLGLARTLLRRLADRVFVHDLGRVRIRIGGRVIDGTQARRKVLALLCFLLSREGFASTRDEVLDSLWPDLDPASALNSLNQTVYFLRRVFEPNYREQDSPGYLHQDGETIWLDADLIDCESRRCHHLIRELDVSPDPNEAWRLVELYSGKFALDFAYEEWASAFREALHAAYLRVIEQRVRRDMDEGQFGRAIAIAERAASVESESEELQVALVRLYRMAGAHAAAAEQYGRYAANLRELGVEAPPFDAVVSGPDAIGTPAY